MLPGIFKSVTLSLPERSPAMLSQNFLATRFALLVLALAMQLPTIPAGAQQSPDSNPLVGNPQSPAMAVLGNNGAWIFRKQVNEVTVMFTATHKGKFVTDLQPTDIEVKDDKKPPESILDFRSEADLPLRLGLLIDTSGSVNDRFAFEQQSASEFLRQVLTSEHDQAFVAGFSHRSRVIEDFTSDAVRVEKAARSLHNDQGDTAAFDAIAHACRKLAGYRENHPVARVLVLLSDGDDNASHSTITEALQTAQASEVTIYTVSTNSRGNNMIGENVLQRLAEETGGRAMFPEKKKDVVKAFANLRDELRSRYAVSYRPAQFEPDGRFRRIRIAAKKLGQKLRVHARRGYYALQ
jgi:Ca-activated chloride channel family protein